LVPLIYKIFVNISKYSADMSHISITIWILIKYFTIHIFKLILAYNLLLSYVYGNKFIFYTNIMNDVKTNFCVTVYDIIYHQ
jgi:hypothetical protein